MQVRQKSIQAWLSGGDMAKEVNWALGHSNPKKDGTSREIAPWFTPKLLSTAIQKGTYHSKKIPGAQNHVRLITIWLYHLLEPLQAEIKSGPKVKKEKGVKKEKEIKTEQKEKKMKVEKGVKIEPKAEVKEQNIKAEPSSFKKGKRPASSDLSGESSKTRMLTRAVTRGMNFVGTADLADSDNMTIEEMAGIREEWVYGTADLSDNDSSIDDNDSDEEEER